MEKKYNVQLTYTHKNSNNVSTANSLIRVNKNYETDLISW